MNRRIVVTGIGAITPLGNSVSEFWDGLIASRSGVRTVTRFDPTMFDVHFGGECTTFDPSKYFDMRQAKRMDRFAQLALAAAKMAFADSQLEIYPFDPTRAGVILGTGIGGLTEL